MHFQNKELIIFDLDGTLINSIPDLTLALNIMLKNYDLPTLTVEKTTPFVGNGARPLVRRALESSMEIEGITDKFFEKAFRVYMLAYKENSCVDTYLYPGVYETLKYLNEKGYKMAVCTNKPFEFIEPILSQLGIKSFFTDWIGENSLGEKKPSALPLLHLVKLNKTSIEKSLMIGDSKNDILAAQNAKMDSVGLNYGYNYNENIKDYKPTVVLDDFSELKELF